MQLREKSRHCQEHIDASLPMTYRRAHRLRDEDVAYDAAQKLNSVLGTSTGDGNNETRWMGVAVSYFGALSKLW